MGLALLVSAGFALPAFAQLDSPDSPFYGPANDMQWFEPIDLDIDGRGGSRPTGFFFNYDKLFWTTSGERVEVGDRNTTQRAFRLISAIPLDPVTGQPIATPVLNNSIKNAVPDAAFHGADRYDFGHWSADGSGWLMSVIDGPDQVQTFTLGLGGGTLANGLQSPLGDVYVAFRTNPGALAGFIDLDDGAIGAGGNILGSDDNGDGIADGDGFADDVNDNGQHGNDGFDNAPPFNQPDAGIIGALPDYGDLVTLVTAFRGVTIRNTTKVNGFELMRAHRLDNSHFKVANQNNYFEFHYGARFLQLDDRFFFDGSDPGLSIGRNQWDTTITNNIVGPQVGYRWLQTRGRWEFDSMGKFLWGFNNQNWRQKGFALDGVTPLRPNNPLYLRAASFSYAKNEQEFSPAGELRLNLNYRITDNVKMKLGWTGTLVGGVRRASENIDYALFAGDEGKLMGFRDGGSQELITQGVNIGIEITQ